VKDELSKHSCPLKIPRIVELINMDPNEALEVLADNTAPFSVVF
jgi:hypothetical protein